MKKSDFNLGAETLKVSRRVCDSEVGPPTTLKSAEPVPLPEELFKIVSGWFKSPGFFETEKEWLFASPRVTPRDAVLCGVVRCNRTKEDV